MTEAEIIQAVRELLRRAILTLASVPDPDIRYRLGPKGCWPDFVRQARDAYGSAPPKVRIFQPTPADQSRYLDVLAWLRWYEQEHPVAGSETVRLFTAWVFGAPMWQLQMRCTTNRRAPATAATVRRRLDDLARTIGQRFNAAAQFDAIDECRECSNILANQEDGSEAAQTDLAHLPISPKAWRSAASEAMTAKEKAKALAALEKRLQKNRLAKIGRQQAAKRA